MIEIEQQLHRLTGIVSLRNDDFGHLDGTTTTDDVQQVSFTAILRSRKSPFYLTPFEAPYN